MKEKLLRREAEKEQLKDRVWEETKKLWVVAGPAIFTKFSTFGIGVISQAFIGHIGPVELAAYCLVFSVLLRFSNGILLGMASALETLCGQAYGARQHHMLGIHLQRSWIVLTITVLCLLPLFIFTKPLLAALGQHPQIAETAQTISLWLIPALFSFATSYTCQMFLQAQSKNTIISYLAAISVSAHIVGCWVLTVKCEFGFQGAIASTVVAYWLPNVGQLVFVTGGWCPETWRGFSWLAFQGLWPVVKLSVSSGVMLCLEFWYNTILILLTGNMGNGEVFIDALAICLTINGLGMIISLGFLSAASVRVSNELGKGSSEAVKFSIVVIVLTSFAIGFTLFLFFLLFKGDLAYIFTRSPDVAKAFVDLSPLLAVSLLLNSIQPVLSGVAVGAGWQSVVAYVNIACYYVVGLPVGVVLGYVMNMRVKGVWLGMLFGTFVQTIVLIIITCKTDWDKQVYIARNRLSKWFVAESDEQNHSPNA